MESGIRHSFQNLIEGQIKIPSEQKIMEEMEELIKEMIFTKSKGRCYFK